MNHGGLTVGRRLEKSGDLFGVANVAKKDVHAVGQTFCSRISRQQKNAYPFARVGQLLDNRSAQVTSGAGDQINCILHFKHHPFCR